MSVETDHQNDSALIAASISAPEEFGLIFERHFDAVQAYLARRAGSSVADELCGAVFEAAFAGRGKFQLDRLDSLPWLYGIAGRLLAQYQRREGRRRRAYWRLEHLRPDQSAEDLVELEARLDAHAEQARLYEALSQLKARDRDTLLLHVWERLSCIQVGEALGIPEGTVRSRLHRARLLLRERLATVDQSPRVPGNKESA